MTPMWRPADASADSGPSGRNYRAEMDAMLARADALRDEAASIDLDGAVQATLEKCSAYGSSAHERAVENAARASERVSFAT
jgi:hypothetical protein